MVINNLKIDQKTLVYAAAIAVLPKLIEDQPEDEPDSIKDIARTAVEFGIEIMARVEQVFAVEADRGGKQT